MSQSIIPVTAPAMPPLDEFVEEIKPLWDSHVLTHQGEKYHTLEKRLQEYLGADNISLFANGHLALQVGLRAMGLTSGEVITTPFTFASTTQAILECGLTPVFCDIEADTMVMDAKKIEALITENTKAILPVHVYGMPCDVEEIERIAQKYKLKTIYDAAHAFGEEYRGHKIGTYGDMSMFSFHATKVFNTVEGGALTFSDTMLYDKIYAIRQFGSYEVDEYPYVGTNAKMTEVHAAMGLCNLRYVDESIIKRKAIFEEYKRSLAGINGLSTLSYPKELLPNYSYFPVLFKSEALGISRDDVERELKSKGVLARKYFYPLTSSFKAVTDRFEVQETPIAEKVAQEVLCLPQYPDLPLSTVSDICETILGLIKGRS